MTDWLELTEKDVITEQEKQVEAAYWQSRDVEQVRGEFLRVLEECGRELALIADYVNEDHLGKSPDDLTLADIGDARALLEKLRAISESLGWDHLDDDGGF